MVQAIPVSDLTLRQVKEQFGLVQVDGSAIAAWQAPFAAPSDLERQHELYSVLSILKRIGTTLLP